ncbi:MAG: aspartate--tRNA ligase [Candidatus Eremiobacteraeota bacterium]|nr:aspartate--tRNA ligase [Candidatus Eremiobacteraeota bacterium]
MSEALAGKLSCGALRADDAGRNVELNGWIHRRRDHGGLIFIDLRDRDGITQIVFNPEDAATFAVAESLRSEDVVRVRGVVRARPAGTENTKLATGAIEVPASELHVWSRAETPPFPIVSDERVDENLTLRYRYLDLRRPRMQRNLTVRHRIVKAIRDFFDSRDFLEIETPMLIKATPEGARDYLVPSRLYHGNFYALPQSPQMLKQILMIAGMGRYMQIARCMRDEDQRADRQPEFTQLDVEMSFATEEEVIETMESSMVYTWKEALGLEVPQPLPRLAHADALRRFGNDKPDLRFGLELADVTGAFATSEFALFRTLAESSGSVIGLRFPGGGALSRRDFDALVETTKTLGGKGLVWVALPKEGEVRSSISRFLNEALTGELARRLEAERGDAMLLIGDATADALAVAGRLRIEIGDRIGARDPEKFAFCWVLDFPWCERDPETGEIAPAHHPFTAPAPGQEALIDTDPLAMRAQHYDLVLNGYELGSGSIRNHDPRIQRKIFTMLGLSEAEIADRFGFFLTALDYGAPPHGGMALGIDRIAMIACGETSIREVIAFPKNQGARDLMMDAPASVPEKSLRELGLSIKPPQAT